MWEGVGQGDSSHLVGWERVRRPIEFRGIGVGNLRICNEALRLNYCGVLLWS